MLQPTLAGEHATTHNPSHAHGTPHEHPASHHADYFAVLLGALLGVLYLRLLFLNDRRDKVFSAWRFVSSPPAKFSNLPRGPTLPLLQVLRL